MRVAFLLPADGSSGGSGFHRHMIDGLAGLGHEVVRDAAATDATDMSDATYVIDGRVLPQLDEDWLAGRRAIGLIHHPAPAGTGGEAAQGVQDAGGRRRRLALLRRIIVTSPVTAAWLAAEHGVDPAAIVVVTPGTAPVARSGGSGGPGCAILSVGRLAPRKGHDALIRALSRLFDLDWRLTIAGAADDADHAAALAALAAELGVADRVAFAGAPEPAALEAAWHHADIFALATRHEGYGTAVAQALAHGLPVAVTSGGAAAALMTPEAGIVCDPDDMVTFSKAIRRLIFDMPLRRACAEAAWRIGQTLPDWPQQVAAFAAALA